MGTAHQNIDHQERTMRTNTLLYISATALLGLVLPTSGALAQNYPNTAPNQPVQPRVPVLTPRAPVQRPPVQPKQPSPPFTLSPQKKAEVNRVLDQWERRNKEIKTFDSQFKRWTYDVVFGKPDQAKFIELGVIKFAAPDRGLFRLDKEEKDGKEVPIDPARSEHWICDGKAVWEIDAKQKKVKEHKLPPELQGKAIANSPLPFLFGAEAQKLRQRYFIRIVTPPDVQGQIWLETYPRFQQDAANFHHAVFIINAQDMTPHALRLIQPNAKDYTVYQFYDIVVNDSWRFFKSNPFRPSVPLGWQMIPDTTQSAGRKSK